MIPIAKPLIGAKEKAAVAEVLDSGMLAAGPKVREFEARFAEYCGVPGAVACSSGTSGLCVAMLALDLPPGSKVLTTPFSFIATANSILQANCQPVFLDVDPATFMPTTQAVRQALEADPEIRAVIAVHLYGQACEIRELMDLAFEHGLFVIEDCAQSHGAMENGAKVGSVGDLAVFSFYPTKNMTTGEGGILTGNDQELLERCRLMIDHGAPARYQHETIGFNYRMTSIAAAIGLCQLDDLDERNEQRRRNAQRLKEGLSDLPWLTPPFEREAGYHVYNQYTVKVSDRDRRQRALTEAGVGTAIHYPRLIPDQPFYQSQGHSGEAYPVARELCEQVLCLPVHPALSDADLDWIIQAVRTTEG
jgi:perosamine synthetase